MASLLEYVGCVHIYLGPYRGNPIALYLNRSGAGCRIGPKAYPWNDVVGIGETPNKAAADFEEKWKGKGLTADLYSGPSWEGGIKPEKPVPPKPAVPPKSAGPAPAPGSEGTATAAPSSGSPKPAAAPTTSPTQRAATAPEPVGQKPAARPAHAPSPSPQKPQPVPSDGGSTSSSTNAETAPPAKPSVSRPNPSESSS